VDRQAQRQPDQVDQVPPPGTGGIVTRQETISGLEKDLQDRYPGGRVTVADEGDRVTVAIDQPDDSLRLKLDTARIDGGSLLLARIMARS
jgi:hypothetical protein